MQLTKESFKENLIKALSTLTDDIDVYQSLFRVAPVAEKNVTYNSTDDYIRLGMLNDDTLTKRLFSLGDVVNFLVHPNEEHPRLFPLWIKITLSENASPTSIIELQISMRFRTASQLKNRDTGHPPFCLKDVK